MSDRTCGKCGKAMMDGMPIEARIADNKDPFSPEWKEFIKCFTGHKSLNQIKFLLIIQRDRSYIWEEYANEADRTKITFEKYLKKYWDSNLELREAFKHAANVFKDNYLKAQLQNA